VSYSIRWTQAGRKGTRERYHAIGELDDGKGFNVLASRTTDGWAILKRDHADVKDATGKARTAVLTKVYASMTTRWNAKVEGKVTAATIVKPTEKPQDGYSGTVHGEAKVDGQPITFRAGVSGGKVGAVDYKQAPKGAAVILPKLTDAIAKLL
jgi:uncharacterized protein GlcG (DUF336 family)